ncbi:hypothetical protein PFICI_08239 [Pestalotiopsis fici W106-1]|uniref:Heterokaryon incompatibility domain-containing protein n=1 Tax=Pestalotiopsis fici (strain W106-1 / CGMCC3.15140) TaxID=1229662 RepID=W3X3Q8_PESFW|nr:uncharacterized protein PFICI_08239 [Pestalotiopsis fici W106-1]ETS80710.1 hypothetical protein PFICI_08239 [Pestalotiopsis fici W106-1]
MDHLPAPRDAGAPIRVPYLDVIPYDLVDDLPLDAALEHFRQFPDRREFGHQGTIARDLDLAKLATVVQSWLYFGLISAFFNTHIDLTDFTTTRPPDDPLRDPGPVCVTSAHSNKLLKKLDRREREARNKERESYSEERGETDRHRKEVLREQRKALSASRAKRRKLRDDLCIYSRHTVSSLDEEDIEKSPDLAAICLSIQLLTITLLGCNPTKDPSIGWRDNDDDSSIEPDDGLSDLPCWTKLYLYGWLFGISIKSFFWSIPSKVKALFRYEPAPPPATHEIYYPSYFLDLSHWESNILERKMVRNGWCRSDLDHIFTSQDLLTIYYLSQIRRSPVLSLPHFQCTREECFPFDSPSRPPYRRSHATDTCQCRDIHVDTESLCRIIEDGDIPLVYVEPAGHGTFCLKLTRMGSLSEYVSISHVWSDGLGNPDANSLFQCELESIMDSFPEVPLDSDTRLRTLKGQLQMVLRHLKYKFVSRDEPVFRKQLFWMDTLCIPVACASNTPDQVARINALKQRAIHHMNMVYYGATTHAMILDAQLRKISLTGAPKCEIAARIAFSHWNSRCWTLQEGALGSTWLVKFSDGLLGGDRFRTSPRRLEEEDSHMRNHMLQYLKEPETIFEADELSHPMPRTECSVEEHIRKQLVSVLEGPMQLFSDSDGIFQSDEDSLAAKDHAARDVSSFSDIWNMLAWRSTSEEKDVPGIFANLLTFNFHQLVQYFPGHNMLMGLLWNLEGVPLTLLFNQGPRLKAADDEMSTEAGARYALLLDGDPRSTEREPEEDTRTIRGALLGVREYMPIDYEDTDEQRKDYPRNGLRISAIFDCPAELHLYKSQTAPEDVPVVAIDAVELLRNMKIGRSFSRLIRAIQNL